MAAPQKGLKTLQIFVGEFLGICQAHATQPDKIQILLFFDTPYTASSLICPCAGPMCNRVC